ncbi:cytochrome c family protein [Hoeflea sp. YIM 152468]|uniref:c-type cytochrome n=1 Tax=Hoeflea sp. YIM 152468 TaxID=3031759 RepID=UPI0023DBAD98|nr:cytochrome c family protein [Hoeflea sp. YIM 152468]MDF1609756.1 cytochrome c family protein [Hoeflea sp. YIM 152468]
MRISLSMLFGAVIAAAVSVPTAALADGDAAKGAKVFKKCAACHTAVEAKNKVGPHLVDIIDRPIASVEGYKYSKAMSEYATEVPTWTVEALEAYLRSPRGVVKGTKMAFAGLKKDDEVENVIAYMTDPAAAE